MITLLTPGCPVQVIVASSTLDDHIVQSWLLKADEYSEAVAMSISLMGANKI